MRLTLLSSTLLFAATRGDEVCLDEESSLIQEAKPAKTHRRDSAPLTGLLESAKGFLTNGATEDVVVFAQETLREVSEVIIPTLVNESVADQGWMDSEWNRFQGAINAMSERNLAITSWNDAERTASGVHRSCRVTESQKCEEKRQCEMHLYGLWRAWVQEEELLRTEHDHIEGHFCVKNANGEYTANGTLHEFRVDAADWMHEWVEQKEDVDAAEAAYNGYIDTCNTKHGNLDTQSNTCNNNQEQLEDAACAHASAIAENLRLFHAEWASLHASYQGITDLVYNQTQDRFREYKTLVIVDCLLHRVSELNGRPCDETTGTVDDQMTHCEERGHELTICTEQPELCPTYNPPPANPDNCADRDSVVAGCLPVMQPWPCNGAWESTEGVDSYDSLPPPYVAPPVPEFSSENPGCNSYPDCRVCSAEEDISRHYTYDYQTWIAAPESFAFNHATFDETATQYSTRYQLG